MVDIAAPALGVVLDAQRRVVDVEAGSAAGRAGIRRGDERERVGAVSTQPSLAGAKRLLQGAKPGTVLPVTISRAGHDVTIPVELMHGRCGCAAAGCAPVTPVPAGRQLDLL